MSQKSKNPRAILAARGRGVKRWQLKSVTSCKSDMFFTKITF